MKVKIVVCVCVCVCVYLIVCNLYHVCLYMLRYPRTPIVAQSDIHMSTVQQSQFVVEKSGVLAYKPSPYFVH